MESIRGTDSLKNRKTNERKASNRRLRFSLVSFWTFSCPTRDFLTFNCLCESPFRNQWCHFDDVHASAVALRQNETTACFTDWMFSMCDAALLRFLCWAWGLSWLAAEPAQHEKQTKERLPTGTVQPLHRFSTLPFKKKKAKLFIVSPLFLLQLFPFSSFLSPLFFPACTQRFPHL